MKKLNEAGKKSPDGSQDEANVASGSGTTTKTAPKEEEDVYEFKTTPKDSSSSGDDKSDGGKVNMLVIYIDVRTEGITFLINELFHFLVLIFSRALINHPMKKVTIKHQNDLIRISK